MPTNMQPAPDKDLTSDEGPPQEEKVFPLPVAGEATLTRIRELYPNVESEIQDKDHLMRGFVSHQLALGGTTFTIRTLRRRELDALASAKLSADADADVSTFLANQLNTLAVAITHVNEDVWSLKALNTESIDEWLTDSSVVKVKEYVRDWDAALVEILLLAQRELELVKAILLRENLKNL